MLALQGNHFIISGFALEYLLYWSLIADKEFMWLTWQANHALLEEIKEVNQRLIDTVVDISDEEVDSTAAVATAEGTEGTIVKCSFTAVALSPSLKSQFASAQMVCSQNS